MEQINNYMKAALLLSIFILSVQSIFAFAISSAYYPDNPLYSRAGETQDVFMTLQNLAGSEDVHIRAVITKGNEYISLTDPSDVYLVPVGQKTKVNFRVTAPASAKKGDSFPVTIDFTTIKSGEGGTLAIASSIGQRFNIVIGEEKDFAPQPTQPVSQPELPRQENKLNSPMIFALVLGSLILIILILYFLKKSPKKTAKRKLQR